MEWKQSYGVYTLNIKGILQIVVEYKSREEKPYQVTISGFASKSLSVGYFDEIDEAKKMGLRKAKVLLQQAVLSIKEN